MSEQQACQNTDREIWRETPGDYYAPSIFVTENGGIGINVGGYCTVLPVREWHKLAGPHRNPNEAAQPQGEDCGKVIDKSAIYSVFYHGKYRDGLSEREAFGRAIGPHLHSPAIDEGMIKRGAMAIHPLLHGVPYRSLVPAAREDLRRIADTCLQAALSHGDE